MPDDERHGGTRDSHEYGRRHRRSEGAAPPPPTEQPRRRRRSVESGGVSVADLVQRHTGSRPDLTPVNPDQLRQNGVMTGRRARHDEPAAPPPPPPSRRGTADPSIAAALDGADGFPPDRAAPAHGGQPGSNGFPRDEAGHRPGGASSYFTIPSEALRGSYGDEDVPQHDAYPPAEKPSGRRARRASESSGPTFPSVDAGYAADAPRHGTRAPEPDAGPPRRSGARRARDTAAPGPVEAPGTGFPPDPHNGFAPDSAAPHPNGFGPGLGDDPRNGFAPGEDTRGGFPLDGAAPHPNGFGPGDPGVGFGHDARNGFAPDNADPNGFGTGNPRDGFGHDARNGFGEDPRHGFGPDDHRNGFPLDNAAPHSNGFAPGDPRDGFGGDPMNGFAPGEDTRGGFPLDGGAPHRNGARRSGEGSGPRDGFAPDGAHRASEGPGHGFAPDGGLPSPSPRRPGEGSGPRNGFPPDGLPAPGPRHPGEASTHLPLPGDNGFAPGPAAPRPGRRGETSGRMPAVPDPLNGFGPDLDAPRPGRRAEMSGHMPAVPDPLNGYGPDLDAPRPGRRAEMSGHMPAVPDPLNGYGPDLDAPRPGRRGETSGRMPIDPGSGPRNGFPPDNPPSPTRRVGEASVHMPFPTDDGAFPDGGAPRRDRRGRRFPPGSDARPVGEASAHFGVPGDDPRLPGEGSGPRGLMPGRPGEGFPEPSPGRPEGAARRRAARATSPRPELGPRPAPSPFPLDAPPQPGQESGQFPIDEFRQQEPGNELSEPRLTPAAIDAPDSKPRRPGVPPVPPPPPRPMGDDDLVTMTTEMEAIGDEVQKRRSIDHTLARFSAVHDEIKAEEREKKAKRRKLRPWERDDEMDRLDELDAQQSMAMVIPKLDPRDDDEDEDDYADPKKGKKKRRWRKGKNTGKAFVVFFAGMIFLSTAVAWGFKSHIDASTQQVPALDLGSAAIKDANAQLGDENFLLVGSDTRSGATAEDGVGDDQEVQGARSDTVMIAHVPKDRERVVVVSFPRDLEVTRPTCEGWNSKTGAYTGEQHPEAKRVKLNTAYQVGGPMCVTKLVQQLSGLAVNHFVGIDFHGFKDMVDAVQGVNVCVERPMKDTVLGMVVPEAGKSVRLTGDQALNFVRARHVVGDPTSDYGRITRQQRFLSSLLRKAMSSEVLLSPGKLTNFVDAFSKATFGDNIGIDQLFTLGQSMQGVDAGRVTFITVPTVGTENERHNEDLRTDDSNALFEAIRQNTPLPGEAPKQDDASQKNQPAQQKKGLLQTQDPIDASGIKLQVLNGGNQTGGIARDTADQLADLGFQIMRVDTAPEPTDKTVIRYGKGHEDAARTVQSVIPGATLVEDPSAAGAIMLVIGPDFDGRVGSGDGTGVPPAEVPGNLSTVNAGDVSCA